MTAFLALYVGENVTNAEVMAMTANRKIVDDFAKLMLAHPPGLQESADAPQENAGVVPSEQRKRLELVRDTST